MAHLSKHLHLKVPPPWSEACRLQPYTPPGPYPGRVQQSPICRRHIQPFIAICMHLQNGLRQLHNSPPTFVNSSSERMVHTNLLGGRKTLWNCVCVRAYMCVCVRRRVSCSFTLTQWVFFGLCILPEKGHISTKLTHTHAGWGWVQYHAQAALAPRQRRWLPSCFLSCIRRLQLL